MIRLHSMEILKPFEPACTQSDAAMFSKCNGQHSMLAEKVQTGCDPWSCETLLDEGPLQL